MGDRPNEGAQKRKKAPEKQPRCDVCSRDSFEESLLRCHRCISAQHTFCLDTPIVAFPGRKWVCSACTTAALPRPRKRRLSSNSVGGEDRESAPPVANGIVKGKGVAVNGIKSNDSVSNGAVGRPTASKRTKRSPPRAAESAPSVAEVPRQGAPDSGCSDPPRPGSNASDTERDSSDPGSTITLFCRRDFRRYLRWKRRQLASQDDERRRGEQIRARRTFSSIIANAVR